MKLMLASRASLDCHPHGNSLEIFFDWVAQYAHGSKGKAQIEHIKRCSMTNESREFCPSADIYG